MIYTLSLSLHRHPWSDRHSPQTITFTKFSSSPQNKRNFPWPHLGNCLAFVLPADCGANMGVWKIGDTRRKDIGKLMINHGTLGTCSTLGCSIFKQPRIQELMRSTGTKETKDKNSISIQHVGSVQQQSECGQWTSNNQKGNRFDSTTPLWLSQKNIDLKHSESTKLGPGPFYSCCGIPKLQDF